MRVVLNFYVNSPIIRQSIEMIFRQHMGNPLQGRPADNITNRKMVPFLIAENNIMEACLDVVSFISGD